MSVIAVVGAGGSGKTTWINQKFKGKRIIHAVPYTRWLSHIHTPLVEVLMGIERTIQGLKVKLVGEKETVIMDRCFIDAEVYGRYSHCYWITKLFNRIIYKPEVIYLLDPVEVKAKREFEQKDFEKLTDGYWMTLVSNGYRIPITTDNHICEKYKFGEVFKFTKYTNQR